MTRMNSIIWATVWTTLLLIVFLIFAGCAEADGRSHYYVECPYGHHCCHWGACDYGFSSCCQTPWWLDDEPLCCKEYYFND